jgi:hypothetical protein
MPIRPPSRGSRRARLGRSTVVDARFDNSTSISSANRLQSLTSLALPELLFAQRPLRVEGQRPVSGLPNLRKDIQGNFHWWLTGIDLRDDTSEMI